MVEAFSDLNLHFRTAFAASSRAWYVVFPSLFLNFNFFFGLMVEVL